MLIRGQRVVLPDGTRPATIHARNGVITEITAYNNHAAGVTDVGGAVVIPGVVDTHVHMNEPGRTEWEGFATATRAAVAGGITTLVDMPLNSIPATTTLGGLQAKLQSLSESSGASGNVYFWGGIVPGNTDQLEPLDKAGVLGFKCFMTPSGVDEFPHVTEADLRSAMPVLQRLGAPLLAHAEIEIPPAREPSGQYRDYLASRPRSSEHKAIELLIRLCREYGTRVHIVHLSSADAVPMLRAAKREGLPITVETCPHYLTFCAEEIPAGATQFKCAPPIRERENRERLWEALDEGVIDMVVSDHSPCPPEMKPPGDFFRAWGGISSLQLGLSIVWTEASRRGFSLNRVVEWMCAAPARLAGLKKGKIEIGYDADVVVFNPEATFICDPSRLHHRHKLTPYADRKLTGVVQ